MLDLHVQLIVLKDTIFGRVEGGLRLGLSFGYAWELHCHIFSHKGLRLLLVGLFERAKLLPSHLTLLTAVQGRTAVDFDHITGGCGAFLLTARLEQWVWVLAMEPKLATHNQ